jgi:FtsP/CotA-like multicopper oxidase with cupredoxin domain
MEFMKRRRFIVSAISAAVAGSALATDACSSGVVGTHFDPTSPIRPGHTLTVQYAVTNFSGYKLRTRTYDGRTSGPIIETRPGETLSFAIVNRLPPNPPAHYPTPSVEIPLVRNAMEAMNPLASGLTRASGKIDPDNNPHGFNTTNLHVHGIQTLPHLFDPVGTSDPAAMMIEIQPGESFRYDFPVPPDHPSGLYWYHPHKHGSTDVQVSGGMAGLIVVRGPIDEVPEIAAAREIFMVMQSLLVNRAPGGAPFYEREYFAYEPPTKGGYLGFTNYTMFTLNGRGLYWVDNHGGKNTYTRLDVPEYTVAPGEVVRLRLLNGNNSLTLLLVLEGFEVWQIGFDGVNLLTPAIKDMSGAGVTSITTENYRTLPIQVAGPANRLELLLRAPLHAGTYVLKSLGSTAISGLGNKPDTMELARFEVRGNPVKMGIPRALPKPAREYPLIDDAEIVARRKFVFDIETSTAILVGFQFTVNGELYDMSKCPTHVKVGTCEEWRIENQDVLEPHPFHIHTNSFQLIATNDVPVDPVQIWDTFPVPPKSSSGKNGSIVVRIRFKEWVGKDVFHCHVLDHEDTGMMQNFLIT